MTGLPAYCKYTPATYGGPAPMSQAPPTAQLLSRLYISSAPAYPLAGLPICFKTSDSSKAVPPVRCKCTPPTYGGPAYMLQAPPPAQPRACLCISNALFLLLAGPPLYWNYILLPFGGPTHVVHDPPTAP